MKQLAKANFRILNSSEEPYTEEGTQKLTSGIFTSEYSGDLMGRSILMELKNYSSPNIASVYGLERFTGTLEGRSGSFVIEHIGIYNNGVIVSTRSIVANSGTHELTGINGKAHFDAETAESYEITFEYQFV